MFAAGVKAPKAVLSAQRSSIIEAFGRAHYVRYDESSATRLVDIASTVRDKYDGDLRELATAGEHDVKAAERLVKQFNGIGDTGADIFLREVQEVWTWVRPHFDERATNAARGIGLPADPRKRSELAPRRTAGLAAALVRASLDDDIRAELAK